jgi:hypothetical protein
MFYGLDGHGQREAVEKMDLRCGNERLQLEPSAVEPSRPSSPGLPPVLQLNQLLETVR